MFFFKDTATTEIYTYLHTLSLHDALPIFRRLSAVSLSKIEDFAGCGAITVLVRVEGTSKSARGANTFVKISDASAEIECATEHMLTTGDLIVAEIARKTTEARWRVVSFRMFNKDDTPQRMRIDLKATHKWEEIRKIIIAAGRGTDRIDVIKTQEIGK